MESSATKKAQPNRPAPALGYNLTKDTENIIEETKALAGFSIEMTRDNFKLKKYRSPKKLTCKKKRLFQKVHSPHSFVLSKDPLRSPKIPLKIPKSPKFQPNCEKFISTITSTTFAQMKEQIANRQIQVPIANDSSKAIPNQLNTRVMQSPSIISRNNFFQNSFTNQNSSFNKKPFNRNLKCLKKRFRNSRINPRRLFSVELRKRSPKQVKEFIKPKKQDSCMVVTKFSNNDSRESSVFKKKKLSKFSQFRNGPKHNTARISKITSRQYNSDIKSSIKGKSMRSYSPIKSKEILSSIMSHKANLSPCKNILPLNISDQITITDKIRKLNLRKKIKQPEGDSKVDKLLRTMVMENQDKDKKESHKKLTTAQILALIKKRKKSVMKEFLGI